MTNQVTCYIGVDVGLTASKAAAFDAEGREVGVVHARTPRTSVTAHRHDVDMAGLAETVVSLLGDLAGKLAADGYVPAGIGVAAHGNGLYPVDESLRPVGPAIASSDSRAQHIVDAIEPEAARRLAAETGSIPWAAQPAVLLRWMHDAEPEAYARTRWALSCKDWVTSQLTGVPSADYSDASAFGMVALDTRAYTPTALELVGLPAADLGRFPPLRESGQVVAGLSARVAELTGLPEGLPVIAGCMDCVAATLGAGGRAPGDVTIIVGTWAINGVVVPAATPAPEVTLSALMPDSGTMLAMEVAPTSAANLDWLSSASVPHRQTGGGVPAADLLEEAATVAPGAGGLLFLPFVNGAPEHPAASGTFLGVSAVHRRGHLTRAVIEGSPSITGCSSTGSWPAGPMSATGPGGWPAAAPGRRSGRRCSPTCSAVPSGGSSPASWARGGSPRCCPPRSGTATCRGRSATPTTCACVPVPPGRRTSGRRRCSTGASPGCRPHGWRSSGTVRRGSNPLPRTPRAEPRPPTPAWIRRPGAPASRARGDRTSRGTSGGSVKARCRARAGSRTPWASR